MKDLGGRRIAILDKEGIDYAHISLTTPGPEAFPVEIARKNAESTGLCPK